MSCSGWLVGLSLLFLQVPPPAPEVDVGRELEAARRAIFARETAELSRLADDQARRGDDQAARQIRERLPRPVAPDGATRIVPLPEVVDPRPARSADAWRAGLEEIESRSAAELFELAKRAAGSKPAHYTRASLYLRAVLERQPDHREARRLLGYVPYKGGWAKPFAVRQFREGNVRHPIFGWVKADWVPHLDRGELPTPPSKGGKVRWLAAEEADRLRANWDPPWHISTEHFEIRTDVTLAETISFGRRLEAFHDLFMTLMADILGETIPLIRRFKDPVLTGESSYRPHLVHYFGTKEEYLERLVPRYGSEISKSLGYYDPPKAGRGGRSTAYFFRDPNGQLPMTATLYHEVSHQLLFETSGPNAFNKNVGNYWVFEGLGTYFETVTPQPDGSLEVGGLVGRRIEEALKSLLDQDRFVPLSRFVGLDQNAFSREDLIYVHYQQAMALAVFLMQWHEGTYRDAFLDYIQDAYRGRIKRTTGRSLQDRLGEPYSTLDKQFLAFLKDGRSQGRGAEPAALKPASSKPDSGGAIRTVPSGR